MVHGKWEWRWLAHGPRVHLFWWLVENWCARSNNSSSCPCPTSHHPLGQSWPSAVAAAEKGVPVKGDHGSKIPTAFPPRLRRPSFFFFFSGLLRLHAATSATLLHRSVGVGVVYLFYFIIKRAVQLRAPPPDPSGRGRQRPRIHGCSWAHQPGWVWFVQVCSGAAIGLTGCPVCKLRVAFRILLPMCRSQIDRRRTWHTVGLDGTCDSSLDGVNGRSVSATPTLTPALNSSSPAACL